MNSRHVVANTSKIIFEIVKPATVLVSQQCWLTGYRWIRFLTQQSMTPYSVDDKNKITRIVHYLQAASECYMLYKLVRWRLLVNYLTLHTSTTCLLRAVLAVRISRSSLAVVVRLRTSPPPDTSPRTFPPTSLNRTFPPPGLPPRKTCIELSFTLRFALYCRALR